MKGIGRGLIFATFLLGGCQATHDVAVTSYHVATAPVHYVFGRSGDDSSTTTTSDVTVPGRPVRARESASTQRPQAGSERGPIPSSTVAPRVRRQETAQIKPKPSPSPHGSSTQPAFPTAKPIPDKPGYVLSPFDPGGRYVDVSGYTSGSKVKDPWTDKIFVVP
jgi:hypothetical protein